MSLFVSRKDSPRKQYIATDTFNTQFFSYSTSINADRVVVGSLVVNSAGNATNCKAGHILRENGKKLITGIDPNLTDPNSGLPYTYLVGVYDANSFLSGYIDPNSSVFAVFNNNKSPQLNALNEVTDGVTGNQSLGSPIFTSGKVTAASFTTTGAGGGGLLGSNITISTINAYDIIASNVVTAASFTTTGGGGGSIVLPSISYSNITATNITGSNTLTSSNVNAYNFRASNAFNVTNLIANTITTTLFSTSNITTSNITASNTFTTLGTIGNAFSSTNIYTSSIYASTVTAYAYSNIGGGAGGSIGTNIVARGNVSIGPGAVTINCPQYTANSIVLLSYQGTTLMPTVAGKFLAGAGDIGNFGGLGVYHGAPTQFVIWTGIGATITYVVIN